MYEAQLPTDWTYILNDSGASVVMCSTEEIFHTLNDVVLTQTPHVHSTLCLDAQHGAAYAYSTAVERVSSKNMLSKITLPPMPEDLANLLYTSGTTGKPKGVELTHSNFCSNIHGGRAMAGDPFELVSPKDRSLAFLPWAHSYGQTVELWMGMSAGASAGICRGIPHILDDLAMVQPTILFSVPTLYKKVYDGVQNKIEAGGDSLPSRLLRKALELGHENASYRRGEKDEPLPFMQRMQFAALDKIVLSKIRDRFGGRLRYGCVAGAACPTPVLEFMDSIGIPICEGYGLTETSPIITLNVPDARTVGSVGRPLHDVTVYIVDEDGKPVQPGAEGEICCVGPNVMRGYYNNPEATNEVITVAPDGVSRMYVHACFPT